VGGPPDIASIASLVGHAARARILLALMGGRALTATELALEADVTPQTASAHLAKLESARLIRVQRQGRHRYFALADRTVAQLIEKLCGVAARDTSSKLRTGPRDPALREARVCYDHLAGERAVQLYDALLARGRLALDGRHGDGLRVTPAGERFFEGLGVDMDALARARRPTCRPCLDWSVRRHHLAGGLGAALLEMIFARRWARRHPASRAVVFPAGGREKLERAFELRALPKAS
jgi:DNA-binding transcriptional ArsR family regulator